jgi:hypothetical protein
VDEPHAKSKEAILTSGEGNIWTQPRVVISQPVKELSEVTQAWIRGRGSGASHQLPLGFRALGKLIVVAARGTAPQVYIMIAWHHKQVISHAFAGP